MHNFNDLHIGNFSDARNTCDTRGTRCDTRRDTLRVTFIVATGTTFGHHVNRNWNRAQ